MLAAALCAVLIQPQLPPIRRPTIPGFDIPGLGRLFGEDQPFTTSLDDAVRGLKNLDGWSPATWVTLDASHLNAKGTWTLKPGHYRARIQSYCARPGTPGPWAGDGYGAGTYEGSRSGLLRDLVRRANTKPELAQQDIQLLVWALVSRTKPKDLKGGAQTAARALLTPEERRDLDGWGMEHYSDSVLRQALGPLDRAMRPLHEMQNKMRGMLAKANQPFEEIERFAVLPPDEKGKSEIDRGRWLWHPNGYAIRYEPKHYHDTTISIVVPERFGLTRDAKGRIVRLDGPSGYSSEVEYDDEAAPVPCPTDASVVAYKFKRVRLTAPNPADAATPLTAQFDDVGWTFVRRPRLAWVTPFFEGVFAGPAGQLPGWFTRWQERAERIQEARESAAEAQRQAERAGRIARGEASPDDFEDADHYRDGLEAASGSPADRAEWIAEHHARQGEALVYAINVLETLPDGTEVDPGDRVMVPGNRGGQRLIGSTRGF